MAASIANAESIEGIFNALTAFINEDLVKQIKGIFVFDVKGESWARSKYDVSSGTLASRAPGSGAEKWTEICPHLGTSRARCLPCVQLREQRR